MTYYIALGLLIWGCVSFIACIAWIAMRVQRSKRTTYEYPMAWQQTEYDRER